MTATQLTKGERIFIWRRRKKLNQKQAGEELGLKRHEIFRIEKGLKVRCGIPVQPLGNLKPLEICVLKRRRAKMTQTELGKKIGCSRWWVNQMELGLEDSGKLVKFWKKGNGQVSTTKK